jgi:hypothetical protein
MYAGVVYGLLVYALSYSTKSDVPDMKLLSERILRSLKRMASQQYDQATYGDLMLAVANTMMGSREIGAPQALMFILGHRMKWVSKKVVRLDTSLPVLRRRFLCHQPDGLHDVPLVEREEAGGYPIAPGVLLQESRSTYRNYKSYALRPLDVEVEVEVFGSDDYGQKKATKLILLRDISFVKFLAHFEEETLNFNPASHTRLRNRRIQLLPDENGRRVWMRQRTRPAVIMFIPVFAISDHNDQSAYSLLVAHVPWQSESELVEGYESPITALEAKMHLFPEDIQRYFEHRRRFEAVLEETIAYSSALHAPQSHSSVRVYFHEDEEAFDAGRDTDFLQAGDSVVDFVSIMDPDNRFFAEDPLHQSSVDALLFSSRQSSSVVKVLQTKCVKDQVHKFTSNLNKKFLDQRSDQCIPQRGHNRHTLSSAAREDYEWQSLPASHRFRLTRFDRATIAADKGTLTQSKKQYGAYILIEHLLRQNSEVSIANEVLQVNLLLLSRTTSFLNLTDCEYLYKTSSNIICIKSTALEYAQRSLKKLCTVAVRASPTSFPGIPQPRLDVQLYRM